MEVLQSKDGRYDSKHILNTCTKPVPQTILDAIEDGCTIEALERAAKDFDIFKYKTQITIHGLFPNLSTQRIGEYKNLVRNKNLSVGIRYSAIDCEKRERMMNKLSYFGWRYHRTSTEQFFYIEKHCVTNVEFVKAFGSLTEKLNTIDTSLFNGNAFISKGILPYLGIIVVRLSVNINSIYEKDLESSVVNLCGCKDMNEVNTKIQALKDEWKAERARKEEERKIQQAKNDAMFEEYFKQNPLPSEYPLKENYQLKDGDIVMKVKKYVTQEGNPTHTLTFYKVVKNYGSLVIRVCDQNGENVEKHGRKPNCTIGTFRVKSAPVIEKEVKAPAKVAKVEPKENVIKGSYSIIDYSEKAIAVTGDTKSIKDTLKNLGGRFNPRLTCGAGWIFSKSKESAVRAAIC